MTDDLEGSLSDGTWFLDGSAGTTGSARDRTRDFLAAAPEPVPERACQNALLVVSELVGNAVRHAPGPCTLALDLTRRALTIAVTDTSHSSPRPRAPDLVHGGGGFGWNLLARLTQSLDVRTHANDGKTVTARLAMV